MSGLPLPARPLIAMPSRFSHQASALRHRAMVGSRNLIAAVYAAGGEPLLVHPVAPDGVVSDDEVAARLRWADGILLPGGGDLAARWSGQPDHPTLYDVDVEQDAFDLAAARVALAAGVPVLAVCRGTQVVNVVARRDPGAGHGRARRRDRPPPQPRPPHHRRPRHPRGLHRGGVGRGLLLPPPVPGRAGCRPGRHRALRGGRGRGGRAARARPAGSSASSGTPRTPGRPTPSSSTYSAPSSTRAGLGADGSPWVPGESSLHTGVHTVGSDNSPC